MIKLELIFFFGINYIGWIILFFRKEDKFLLVKIFKDKLSDFDIYNKEQVVKLFKDIFLNVKEEYKLSGLFDVDIYVNEDYGMIIEIYNLCFYNDEIDVKIKFHLDSLFLVEINSNQILDYDEVYYYNDKFYGIYKDILDNEVIYKEVDNIINDGIRIC